MLSLLDYYGCSLGIAGHSNNLAHELMLEGRLVIREIEGNLLMPEIGRLC